MLRGCGERLIAGLLALLFGILSGACFFGNRGWTPDDLIERLFKATVEHVFFSISFVCVVVLVWSIFTPRWMERIMLRAQKHIVGTLAAVILLSAISIFAAFSAQ